MRVAALLWKVVDMGDGAGVVKALWRFPVKSMLGEQVTRVDVEAAGVLGDRAFALLDVETGKVVSAKHPKRWPNLFSFRAAYVEPPRPGADLPPARITLPDGSSVLTDDADVDEVLSRHFGRRVVLARAAPADFTIDQYHPDIEQLDPQGHRDTLVDQPLGSAFFAAAGMPSAVPVGSFLDVFPVSVLTTSTLAHLTGISPEVRFDERRFRMNVIVSTEESGPVENDWPGHQVTVGTQVRLTVTIPDPRCVMTALGQEDLPYDAGVLRTLVRHNRLEVGGSGRYPCTGVYAVVETAGAVRVGDPVAVQ